MSIVRIGMSERKNYASGYDAIFKGKKKPAAPAAATATKPAAKKAAPAKKAAKKK